MRRTLIGICIIATIAMSSCQRQTNGLAARVLNARLASGQQRHLGDASTIQLSTEAIVDESAHLGQADIEAQFNNMDTDQDGYILASELKVFLQETGQDSSDAKVSEMMAAADLGKDVKISLQEFSQMMAKLSQQSGSQQDSSIEQPSTDLAEQFKQMDKDQDGFVVASELRTLLQQNGEPLSEELVAAMMP